MAVEGVALQFAYGKRVGLSTAIILSGTIGLRLLSSIERV